MKVNHSRLILRLTWVAALLLIATTVVSCTAVGGASSIQPPKDGTLVMLALADGPVYGEAVLVGEPGGGEVNVLVFDYDSRELRLGRLDLGGEPVGQWTALSKLDEYHTGQTHVATDSIGRTWYANGVFFGFVTPDDAAFVPVELPIGVAVGTELPGIVNGLAVDENDHVWVSRAAGRVVNELDTSSWRFSEHSLDPAMGTASDLIASGDVLTAFDSSTPEQHAWTLSTDSPLRGWASLDQPGVFMGTAGGRLLYAVADESLLLIDPASPASPTRVPFKGVGSGGVVVHADDDSIWYFHAGTLTCLESISGARTEYVLPEVRGGATGEPGVADAEASDVSGGTEQTVVLTPEFGRAVADESGSLWFTYSAGTAFSACALR